MSIEIGPNLEPAVRMTRAEVLRDYTVRDGRITSPGKFEGEPVFAPALWDMAMNGFADSETRDGAFRFRILKEDPLRAEWPELGKWLGRRNRVTLWQSGQGFVYVL